MLARTFGNRTLLHTFTTPFVWAAALPLILLDLAATVYMQVCFPLYGLRRPRRADYISLDRARLRYLPFIDKVNCAYCGYANGVLAYVGRIAADTELYWCGIRHEPRKGFHVPPHHRGFVPYGDAKALDRTFPQR